MVDIIEVNNLRIPIGSHKGKKIDIGSDHRGFNLKDAIISYFLERGYDINDEGTYIPKRCDCPPISNKIGKQISNSYYNTEKFDLVGIGICGSGIEISNLALKYPRVFGGICSKPEQAMSSRVHNNANFLAIPADYIDSLTAIDIVKKFLETPFYSDPEEHDTYLNRYIQKVELEDELFKLPIKK